MRRISLEDGKTFLHIASVILIGLLAYSNTFNVPFHFDDINIIVNNPAVKDFGYFLDDSKLDQLHTHYIDHIRVVMEQRFVGMFTFLLNYRLGGFNTIGYHIFNISVHLLNSLLLYLLIKLTFETPFMKSSRLRGSSGTIALLSALVFTVHPIQTQAVTYIAQRFTALATLFYLATIYFFARWRLNADMSERFFRIFTSGWYAAALLSALLGMFTKEIAFTVPLAAALYEVLFFDGPYRYRLMRLAPILMTMIAIPTSMMDLDEPGGLFEKISAASRIHTDMSRTDYLATQMTVVVTYMKMIFMPIYQNFDYDYPVYRSFFGKEVFGSFLIIAGVLYAGAYYYFLSIRKDPIYRLISFGIFWFFQTLSVESTLIPIGDLIFEHRVYLPSVGAITALVTLTVTTAEGRFKRQAVAFVGALTVLFAWATFERNKVWLSPIALWTDTASKSHEKARPHHMLADALQHAGLFDESIKEYRTALRLNPDYMDSYFNLAHLYAETGRLDLAIEHYHQALRINPTLEEAHISIGNAFSLKGLHDKAIEHYLHALRIEPSVAEVYFHLGNAYHAKGMRKEAAEHFEEAIKFNPSMEEAHYNLGATYIESKRLDLALPCLVNSLRLNPGNLDAKNLIDYIYRKQTAEVR